MTEDTINPNSQLSLLTAILRDLVSDKLEAMGTEEADATKNII